jgi:Ca-activated chloride channel family protein
MDQFRFANPENLYFLLAIPAAVLLFILNVYRQKTALKKLGNSDVVLKLIPELSGTRPVVKFIIFTLSFSLLVFAVSRPQFGSRIEDIKRKGVEVIIALDVSNSMLADDIKPSRLERAKQAISKLTENLSDDKIGLIVFAGDAYTQIPVTTDYISAKMFLSSISPSSVSKQGTSIGSAIELAVNSFTPGTNRSKALIIITDGENHEDDPVAKAKEASNSGIVIHAIGIGSPDGRPIRLTESGQNDFLKDSEGNTVITKLDEKVLVAITSATGGKYVRAAASNIGLDEIYREIGSMKEQELESSIYTQYDDQFQIFVALAGLALILEFVVMDRKNRKLSEFRFFNQLKVRKG